MSTCSSVKVINGQSVSCFRVGDPVFCGPVIAAGEKLVITAGEHERPDQVLLFAWSSPRGRAKRELCFLCAFEPNELRELANVVTSARMLLPVFGYDVHKDN